jgi:hypothetical protein
VGRIREVAIGILAVVLTARLGVVDFNGHKETWYDLNLSKVVERADKYYGTKGVYAVTDEGIKTYNGLVICAAHQSVPYGTLVETSRGIGVVLDYHTVAEDKTLIDVATDWR